MPLALCKENPPLTARFPNKEPVMLKAFPCHDVLYHQSHNVLYHSASFITKCLTYFIPKGPVNNHPLLLQAVACHQTCDKSPSNAGPANWHIETWLGLNELMPQPTALSPNALMYHHTHDSPGTVSVSCCTYICFTITWIEHRSRHDGCWMWGIRYVCIK